MPIYEYECNKCGAVFEIILLKDGNPPPCPTCGSHRTRKLIAAPAIHIKEDHATARIEKRVKDYLKDGKVSDAVRFADKAASMVKSDQVKRIADKLHEKTDKIRKSI
ncbi:MAG: zinc ribbon domain-containing protein [Deltaproteobacteria bacterium]|nr:zinc ribbon domain-containing protein [Deltaproteobacteria bacterium]MBW2018897.1 zinc ribbon domain-containing protein [Deltaproteobacteria bacterium]MBW2073652.1 zinc ribbon domain-containing protein [Deltaproteobacteria bacterium]RLB80348.1 MAG: zinc ribbon domain-containing protein [Deltaproteobacteria bacterium]